jgi:hypothetical protein
MEHHCGKPHADSFFDVQSRPRNMDGSAQSSLMPAAEMATPIDRVRLEREREES